MADLTRLPEISRSGVLNTTVVGGALVHLPESPTAPPQYTAAAAQAGVEVLSTAPVPVMAEIVGALSEGALHFLRVKQGMSMSHYGRPATLANSMATPDSEWDRAGRNTFATRLLEHRADAAQHSAQSSAEFAALDALTDAGYENMQHAANELNLVRRTRAEYFQHHVRQFARSRHAVSCRLQVSPGVVAAVLSPWCLSKQAAYAYVAVVLGHLRRDVRTLRAARIAAGTVSSYSARSSLEAVRRVVEPAIYILSTYTFDPHRLAFCSDDGRVMESIHTRSPHVLAAFAAVCAAGNSDVLIDLAVMRSVAVPVDRVHTDQLREYEELLDNEESAMLLFSRALRHYRLERDASQSGPRVNKDPTLGYVVRAVRRIERNTQACVQRVLEVVSAARSKGVDMSQTLVFVEWGGGIDYAQVIGSLALAKIDVAVDVGQSGTDVPGMDVVAEGDDAACSIQLLLASAQDRNLPRMPIVTYSASDTLESKIGQLSSVYTGGDSGIIYVSGGVVRDEGTPVSVCADASARLNAVFTAAERYNLRMGVAEALIPPLCEHGAGVDVNTFIDSISMVNEDCPSCEAHYRSVVLLSTLCTRDGVRVVKPRSSYGHNGHVSLEFIRGQPRLFEDTATTFDSMVACNVLRNYPWPESPVSPMGGGNPTSPPFSSAMAQVITNIYRLLSGGRTAPLDLLDLQSVAQSLS
ncbi:hypothetical protein [Diplodia seriata polymycovirus 1]|nr:hypothetical protein [Diplodia seriata polymycovirus 1]